MTSRKLNSILLIDDDEINNFINQHVLKSLNITDSIFLARDGNEGLTFLIKYSEENNALPQLIFVDLNMPVMDGFEFTKRLIDSGLLAKFLTTIVVLTTSSNQRDKEKFEAFGIKYYMNKPLNKEKLLDIITVLPYRPPATFTIK